MQIGNPAALDAEREAMRDAFDAVWMNQTERTPLALRAARCAIALDAPRLFHASPNWRILPGSRSVSGTGREPLLA